MLTNDYTLSIIAVYTIRRAKPEEEADRSGSLLIYRSPSMTLVRLSNHLQAITACAFASRASVFLSADLLLLQLFVELSVVL